MKKDVLFGHVGCEDKPVVLSLEQKVHRVLPTYHNKVVSATVVPFRWIIEEGRFLRTPLLHTKRVRGRDKSVVPQGHYIGN